jgi:hypothetical protein
MKHETITINFLIQGENNSMKRTLLIIATVLMFLNTIAVPTVAHADGGGGGSNCSGSSGLCRP